MITNRFVLPVPMRSWRKKEVRSDEKKLGDI